MRRGRPRGGARGGGGGGRGAGRLAGEPVRALGRRVATKEGERDGRVDVGEDCAGAWPEAIEERAELVGEGDALGDESVARADERAQSAGLVGVGTEGLEAGAAGP